MSSTTNSTPNSNIEGKLSVSAVYAKGQIQSVNVELQRPLAAVSQLLCKPDQPIEQSLTLVPLLFSLCLQAQSCAAHTVVAGLRGEDNADMLMLRQYQVVTERLREQLLRLARDWQFPLKAVGLKQMLCSLAFISSRLQMLLGPNHDHTDKTVIAQMQSEVSSLQRVWAALRDKTLRSSRAEQWLKEVYAGVSGVQLPSFTPLLVDGSALFDLLDQGIPATGWLSQGAGFSTDAGDSNELLTQELLQLIDSINQDFELLSRVGEANATFARQLIFRALSAHEGVAGVLTGRGWLAHRIQLDEHKRTALSWQVCAPTDYHFAAQGVLAQQLTGVAVGAQQVEALLRQRTQMLNPCTGYEVSVIHA